MKKQIIKTGLVLIFALALAGCKKDKKQEIPQVEKPPVETVTETETETQIVDTHEGEVRSFYTGEWIKEKKAWNRPVAVMTENTQVTLPQYGLRSADVIYECPVEGGITRLMAIYQNYKKLEKVGNVRSCRLYYVYFAKEFDAVYFHAGESKYALSLLNSSYIENVDGITGKGGTYYYRDNSRKAPHNLYTTGEKLSAAMSDYGYDTKLPDNQVPHYQFTTEDAPNLLSDGQKAAVVKLYYVDAKPWFEYNKKDGLYYRFEFGKKQVDGLNNKQLAVKNIIIQNCASSLKDSSNGTLDINYMSGGDGMYITNGRAVSITWRRESADDITHYYDENGDEIILNPGKTWVAICENKNSSKNIIYSTKKEFRQ